MIDLYNATTNQLLGSITEADLKVLVDALEEEGVNDQDYYIDTATIDVIADGRATEHLVGLLRKAVAAKDGVAERARNESASIVLRIMGILRAGFFGFGLQSTDAPTSLHRRCQGGAVRREPDLPG